MVMMYVKYPLSLRIVEGLLVDRNARLLHPSSICVSLRRPNLTAGSYQLFDKIGPDLGCKRGVGHAPKAAANHEITAVGSDRVVWFFISHRRTCIQ